MSHRGGRDLEVRVAVAPQERETGEPVFGFDCLAGAGELFGTQEADGCREFGAGDFSPDGARRDLDVRVVADALALSQFAVGHEAEFVVIFGKPDRRVHRHAIFPEGGETDVTLAMDFSGNGHADIVNSLKPLRVWSRERKRPK
jgi:hypothetical protein